MPGQSRVVDQDAVIAYHAVRADMGIGHDQVVITNGGFAAILQGAAVNGDAFADRVVIADHQSRRLPLVLQIRGVFTNRGKLVDTVVLANHGRPFEHYVRADDCTLADFHIGPDNAPGADDDVVSQSGTGVDDRSRVNRTHSLRSAQMISAEQTSLPSTVAPHSNFQILRRSLRYFASSTS